jgi:hypothetical protein
VHDLFQVVSYRNATDLGSAEVRASERGRLLYHRWLELVGAKEMGNLISTHFLKAPISRLGRLITHPVVVI